MAGACATLVKAFFDDTASLSSMTDIVQASGDGLSLVPYTGSDRNSLTIGGEMHKVAANIAIGRNHAGVHWRSDYADSLLFGEAVAVSILRDQKDIYSIFQRLHIHQIRRYPHHRVGQTIAFSLLSTDFSVLGNPYPRSFSVIVTGALNRNVTRVSEGSVAAFPRVSHHRARARSAADAGADRRALAAARDRADHRAQRCARTHLLRILPVVSSERRSNPSVWIATVLPVRRVQPHQLHRQ